MPQEKPRPSEGPEWTFVKSGTAVASTLLMTRGNPVVRPGNLPEGKGQRAEQTRALLAQFYPYLIGAFIIPIVTALYLAQAVFIPIAVALLLSFVLGPLVRALQRTGLGSTRGGRVVSVVLIVIFVSLVLGGISYVVARTLDPLIKRPFRRHFGRLAQSYSVCLQIIYPESTQRRMAHGRLLSRIS